jgi:hypothetical protein
MYAGHHSIASKRIEQARKAIQARKAMEGDPLASKPALTSIWIKGLPRAGQATTQEDR